MIEDIHLEAHVGHVHRAGYQLSNPGHQHLGEHQAVSRTNPISISSQSNLVSFNTKHQKQHEQQLSPDIFALRSDQQHQNGDQNTGLITEMLLEAQQHRWLVVGGDESIIVDLSSQDEQIAVGCCFRSTSEIDYALSWRWDFSQGVYRFSGNGSEIPKCAVLCALSVNPDSENFEEKPESRLSLISCANGERKPISTAAARKHAITVWVDIFSHLGDARLIQRTLNHMHEVYLSCRVWADYIDRQQRQRDYRKMISSATRAWMWQEIVASRYQPKTDDIVAHDIHSYIAGQWKLAGQGKARGFIEGAHRLKWYQKQQIWGLPTVVSVFMIDVALMVPRLVVLGIVDLCLGVISLLLVAARAVDCIQDSVVHFRNSTIHFLKHLNIVEMWLRSQTVKGSQTYKQSEEYRQAVKLVMRDTQDSGYFSMMPGRSVIDMVSHPDSIDSMEYLREIVGAIEESRATGQIQGSALDRHLHDYANGFKAKQFHDMRGQFKLPTRVFAESSIIVGDKTWSPDFLISAFQNLASNNITKPSDIVNASFSVITGGKIANMSSGQVQMLLSALALKVGFLTKIVVPARSLEGLRNPLGIAAGNELRVVSFGNASFVEEEGLRLLRCSFDNKCFYVFQDSDESERTRATESQSIKLWKQQIMDLAPHLKHQNSVARLPRWPILRWNESQRQHDWPVHQKVLIGIGAFFGSAFRTAVYRVERWERDTWLGDLETRTLSSEEKSWFLRLAEPLASAVVRADLENQLSGVVEHIDFASSKVSWQILGFAQHKVIVAAVAGGAQSGREHNVAQALVSIMDAWNFYEMAALLGTHWVPKEVVVKPPTHKEDAFDPTPHIIAEGAAGHRIHLTKTEIQNLRRGMSALGHKHPVQPGIFLAGGWELDLAWVSTNQEERKRKVLSA